MKLGSDTRRAAFVRLGMGSVVGPLVLFVAVLHLGGGSPLGLLIAIPAGYLAWVWITDLSALVRSRFEPVTFARRPRYVGMLLAGLLSFLWWHSIFW